ncbi:MAG: metal-dependent hydrolase [Gammaproteobacteria bacterium]
MDTLTQAVSGAVVGIALGENNKLASISLAKRALIVALAAAAPDLDNLLALSGNPFLYLDHHRGITHSIVLLPVWAVLLGLLFAWLLKLKAAKKEVILLAGIGIAAHIAGDLITAYGTMVFTPISSIRFSFPITFIIDLVFSGILLAGLAVAAWKHSARVALFSLLMLGSYLGLQSVLHYHARAIGQAYAEASDLSATEMHVYPQPLSPFRWKIVVVTDKHYHRAYVDFLASETPEPAGADASFFETLNASYQPTDQANWRAVLKYPEAVRIATKARKAWQQPGFASYREFAELPVVLRVREEDSFLCVWFTDMRFALPGRKPPFSYAQCEDEFREWHLKN